MPTSPLILQALYDRALEEEIGIAFRVENRRLFINKLYAFRKESREPQYDNIIIYSPNTGEIFMVKKTVELES